MASIMFNPDDLTNIRDLFTKMNWKIDSDLFNRYCIFFGKLTENEKKLVLELSYKFLCFSPNDYIIGMNKVISEFFIKEEIYDENYCVYVSPLLNLKDYYKEDTKEVYTKSCHLMTYLFKSTELNYNIHLKDKKVIVLENPKILVNYLKEIYSNNAILFLIDDFIGSGETANEALNYYLNDLQIPPERIRVLSLVIHEQSFSVFKKYNVRYYTYEKIKKALTEVEDSSSSEEKIRLMKEIEKKLKIRTSLSMGYNKSEALVKMIRTPNNTFPIFYQKTKNHVPPFPRG